VSLCRASLSRLSLWRVSWRLKAVTFGTSSIWDRRFRANLHTTLRRPRTRCSAASFRRSSGDETSATNLPVWSRLPARLRSVDPLRPSVRGRQTWTNKTFQFPKNWSTVTMILYHTVTAERQSLCCVKKKTTACLSGKHRYIDALWFNVMRTSISPELVWTSYNVVVSLCCILVSTCLEFPALKGAENCWLGQYLSIWLVNNLKLEMQYLKIKPNRIFTTVQYFAGKNLIFNYKLGSFC
jgi:hypothetical protein